ncbi:VOC family protein [Stieleria sp. ICT_E10.1]|uniref:VOC family protein n=1 Tax=Stieleria sedimenti TaxID=2976331 RepID=UPI00218099DC|nr:VOC family protein [Stieleria sedimenti]MCS7465086.1 VOC family protein [Stieleria sedimenti]
MKTKPAFKEAFPYQDDVLALPVCDVSSASEWYCKHFGMNEVQRTTEPVPTVILERDGTRVGFAVNGGDASQDGAAILVSDIHGLKREFGNAGLETGDIRTDDRDGKSFAVFFVVAPDGLCYYFHEPKSGE